LEILNLPETIRVKISSEGAEMISLTPVVSQEMPLAELLRVILGLTGKDVRRISELLLRGSFISGASRFRWTGWRVDTAVLSGALAAFPDPDPARAFDPERCFQAVLRGVSQQIAVSRESGARRRFFRKQDFWGLLVKEATAPAYLTYSYQSSADVFRASLSREARMRVRESSSLLAYDGLARQIRSASIDRVEFYVHR